MRSLSRFPLSLVLAVFGAALLANGVALLHAPLSGAGAALLGAALLLAPRRRRRDRDRSAIRLALRLASFGERIVLVERGDRMRVLRGAPTGLQFVAALQKGALILARER